MKTIHRLITRGLLSQENAKTAEAFVNGEIGDLPTYVAFLLHEFLVQERGVDWMEKKYGWSARSGKVVLGVLLKIAESKTVISVKKTQKREDELQELINYMTGENIDEQIDISKRYKLTQVEAKIFLILRSANGRVVPKEIIMSRAYSDRNVNEWPEPKVIDVYISKIRKKLPEHRISTVWGVGYSMVKTEGDQK